MAKSDDSERQIWGTWEELLLACAVGRHGTRRWESVAMEIRSRSPFPHLVTPQSCRQRYGDLQRRFSDAGAGKDDGGDTDSPPEVPWLEELRKLRVAELRREVEQYDLSIGSLQSKVKKLQEERERSVRESVPGDEKPDRPTEESRPSESTPEAVAGDRISDKVSGPSCWESTSTGSKKDERKPGDESRKPVEAENGRGKLGHPTGDNGGGEMANDAAREESCDGSTEGGASSDPASRPQSGESVAESSKREAEGGEQEKDEDDEEGAKESSDVQSSASLSRRRKQERGRQWRKAVVSGGSSNVGDDAEGDPEAEEVSGVNNVQDAVESGPLVAFLEIIRSDKHGSVFDRRLESQESEDYRSLIRQHVDLEMVQSRIDRIGSGHPYAATEFFRDLLLLCNNALVFYPKDAPESIAALHLRELVSKRKDAALRPPPLPKGEAVPASTLEPKPTATKPKLELDVPVSLLSKTAASTPLIACRKRSAISNKAAAAATSLKEDEVAAEEEEEKPEPDKSSKANEDKWKGKKTTKEKPVLSGTTRGLRTSKTRSGHAGGGAAAGKKPGVAPATNLKSKPVEAAETAESKTDKKTVGGGSAASSAPSTKKQSAASFLNRMKSSNGSTTKPAENAKKSPAGGSGKGSNQKKGGKGENQRDRSSRQGSAAADGGGSTKKSEETVGGKRRSVGRPPKRSAPPPTPPPSKRAREETEPAAPSRPPTSASRKRGRR